MAGWRILLRKQWRFALLLVALALGVKALVPQGYMIMASDGAIMVSVCSGQGPQMIALDAGKHHGDHGDHQDNKKPDHPCAFSGLGMAALGGADPVLLAIAVAYALLLAFRREALPAPAAPAYLRPPLRAPPVIG